MRWQIRALMVLLGCLLMLVIGSGIHGPSYSSATVDLSWPNCSPTPNQAFGSGIIGVTGGLDFSPNPCLAQETSQFSNYSLYTNTGYPGRLYGIKYASYPLDCSHINYNCLGYNFGYNAAEYAINYSSLQAAHSNTWWIDVETENSWTLQPKINRSVLMGAIAAIKQIPFIRQIGIYSTPNQWDFLTNSWNNKLPVWIGTGSASRQVAIDACQTKSFTGGPIILSQYISVLDTDVYCR